MLVLLIEDDLNTIDLMQKYLQKQNHQLKIAECVDTAIDIVDLYNPDLIILDFNLPDMTGRDFILEYSDDLSKLPPFIVTTARGDEKLAVEMMKLGAKDYIVKDSNFWSLFPEVIKRVSREIENDKKRVAVEKALSKMEKIAARAQELAKLGGWELDIVNNNLYWTAESYNIFEISEGTKLTYETFLECVHPDDREYVNIEWKKAYKTNHYDLEHRLLVNGKVKWVREKADLEFDKNGNCIYAVGITQDFTYRVNYEKSLKEREMLLRETQRISKVGGWQFDLTTRKITWTEETYRIFDVEPIGCAINTDEARKQIKACYKLADFLVLKEATKRCHEYNEEFDLELMLTTFKKRNIWVRINAKPHVEDGKVVRIVGNVMDITELKQTRSQLDKFFEQPMNLNMIANLDGIIHRVNRGWYINLGYTKVDLVGKSFLDFIHKDDIEATKKEMKRLSEGHTSFYFENRYRHKNGEYKLFSWSSIVEVNENLIYAVATDITESRLLDYINLSRLHLLQYASDHTLDQLLTETLDEAEKLTDSKIGFYHFVDNNQQSLSLQAWSSRTTSSFCNANIGSRHYPIDKAGVWVECFHKKKPVIHNDYNALPNKKGMPKGHAKILRELAVPVIRGGKVVAILGVGNKENIYTEKDINVVTLIADLAWEITERKKAEEEVKILNLAMEQSPVSTVITDINGNIQYANNHFYKITGYTEDEILFKNPRILKSGIHKDNFYKIFWETILSGKMWEGEFQNRKKDGSLYWEKAIISPVVDDQGNIVNFLAVKEDITEKKEAEKQLFDKISKLERFNKVMVDRELKMHHLKEEINGLLLELGRAKKYSSKE